MSLTGSIVSRVNTKIAVFVNDSNNKISYKIKENENTSTGRIGNMSSSLVESKA